MSCPSLATGFEPCRPSVIPRQAWVRAVRLARMLVLLVLTGLPSTAPAQPMTSEPGDRCTGRNLLPELEAAGELGPMEAKVASVPNGTGKFFRIDRPGLEPSFLYGTMHMSDPRIVTLKPETEAALSASDRLVIETTDILDQVKGYGAILARPDLLNLPAGKKLGDYLTPDMRGRVEARLEELGIPFQSIETLQPWFFSVGLLIPACEAARVAGGAEVLDLVIARKAEAAGKPVLGLETAVEQLEAMASLSLDIQVDSLLATLELKDRMPDIFETMTALYLDGRIALIGPITESAMPLSEVPAQSVEAYADFEERVILRRNRTMLTRLRPVLRQGDTFVAIGALHLPGKEGLVELLRTEGYTVTRIDGP